MAGFLIANSNGSSIEKGDVGEVRHHIGPDGAEPITSKELENFVFVKIPEKLMVDLYPYTGAWLVELDYEVVAHQIPTDGYRIRVFNSQISVGGVGTTTLTREKVENYLNRWNATVFSVAINEVVFDFSIYNLVTSEEFWERKIIASDVVWNEISYNEVIGVHRVSADYSLLGNNPSWIERHFSRRFDIDEPGQTTIISHENQVIVFEFTREVALRFFKKDIKDRVTDVVKKTRWRVGDAVVDNIISQGGIATADWATMQTYLRDKLTE